jgi:hypothetical protein
MCRHTGTLSFWPQTSSRAGEAGCKGSALSWPALGMAESAALRLGRGVAAEPGVRDKTQALLPSGASDRGCVGARSLSSTHDSPSAAGHIPPQCVPVAAPDIPSSLRSRMLSLPPQSLSRSLSGGPPCRRR